MNSTKWKQNRNPAERVWNNLVSTQYNIYTVIWAQVSLILIIKNVGTLFNAEYINTCHRYFYNYFQWKWMSSAQRHNVVIGE